MTPKEIWHKHYLIRKEKRIAESEQKIKVCPCCKNEFKPGYKPKSHFCSEACRLERVALAKSNVKSNRRKWYYKNREAVLACQKKYNASRRELVLAQKTKSYRERMANKWAALVKTCKRCNQQFRPANDRFDYCGAQCQGAYEREQQREYNKRPEIKVIRNAKLRAKKQRDPVFRLQGIVRWTIARALKKAGGRKHSSVIKALPYTIPQLKAHIESQFDNRNGFTWENYGKVWDIDHIVPQCLFRFTDTDSKLFRDCWSLSNLRPLDKKANQQKSAKVIYV